MTARHIPDNPQRKFYEGMGSRSFITTEFAEPAAAKQTNNFQAFAAGVGATVLGAASFQDHPGIWNMITGTDANGRVFILTGGGGFVGTYRLGNGLLRCGTWIRTDTNLSTALQRYTLRSGFFNITLPNIIAFGLGFEYNDAENGGRWQAIAEDSGNGTNETSVDTGITVAAATWYKLEFEVNADATSVEFFIDDVSVATITTSIFLGVFFYSTHIMKLIGTANRGLYIDAVYVYKDIDR